jgi:asparagine synthase (glutamine-hydrolysing)
VLGAREKDSVLSTAADWPAHVDFPTAMGFMDAIGYLPDDVLVKVDRASMAVALEVRAPLLDHRVAEFAWRLPLQHKLQNGTGKILLRRLLDRYLPRHLTERPKAGFGVPIKEWLRGPLREWVEDTLNDERIRRDGFLEPQVVRQFVQEHMSGVRDWHARLWDLLMFCSWVDAQQRS